LGSDDHTGFRTIGVWRADNIRLKRLANERTFRAGGRPLYLRFDKISYGDVLLTRSGTGEGFVIAGITKGRFSHAALWLPYRNESLGLVPEHIGLLLAEADDAGVGTSGFALKSIRHRSGELIAVIPLYNVVAAKLLRHPRLTSLSLELILEATERLQDGEFFKAYSLLGRLADAAHHFPLLQSFVRDYLRSHEIADERIVYGSFCSELVAKFFELLQLPLFETTREANTISPNDLNRSHLSEVLGAVLSGADIGSPPNQSIMMKEAASKRADRTRYLSSMVTMKSDHFRLNEAAAALMDTVSRFNLDDMKRVSKIGSEQATAIKNAISNAQSWGDSNAMSRLIKYEYLAKAIRRSHDEVCRRYYNRHAPPTVGTLTAAEVEVRRIISRLRHRLSVEISRTQLLMSIRYARHLFAHRDLTKVSNNWLIDQRQQLLHLWSTAKNNRAQIAPLLVRLEELSAIEHTDNDRREVRDIFDSALRELPRVPGDRVC
jgi:hypothetical protein